MSSRGLLVRWLINSVGILFAANVLGPLRIEVSGPLNAILAGLLLALLNATLKPLLVLLTLPLNIISLGRFTFVINGALLLGIAKMLQGFEIHSLWNAILASLLVSAISLTVNAIVREP